MWELSCVTAPWVWRTFNLIVAVASLTTEEVRETCLLKKKRIQAAFNFKKSLIHVGVATPFSKCHVIRSGCYGAEDLKWYLCTIGLGAELRLDSLRVYRLEKATYNQLSFGVNVGVSHVLFSRETIGSPEWLDPEWAQREMKEQQEGRIIQSVSLNVHSVTKQIVLKGQWMNIHQIFFYCMLWIIYIYTYIHLTSQGAW